MRYFIGIDPGKEGALVVFSGVNVIKYVMPTIGPELDCHELSRILKKYAEQDSFVCLEQVHAIRGSAAGATFTFGGVYYACRMGLCAFNIPFTLVQPKIWQKVMYQGIPEIRKPPILIKKGKRAGQTMPGRLDTKKMSLIAANRLFPTVDLRKNEKCRVAHDGIVDALLIAEYCRKTKS